MIRKNIKQVKKKATSFIDSYFTSDYRYTIKRFEEKIGYIPNLSNPKTFNEKINWRKLYDRKEIYKCFADKVESKKYVSKICGSEIIPEVLQVTSTVKDIDFAALPESFVIKATHGSGWNRIVLDKQRMNKGEIEEYFRSVLKQDYYKRGREWGYKGLRPRLIVEEFLSDNSGQIPRDYKFFCFSGRVKFIQVDFDRYGKHARNLYGKNLKKLPCRYIYSNYKGEFKMPGNIEDMILLAEKISKGMDFMRVDLYSVNDKIYFGEITNYPENGLGIFSPSKYDLKFGGYWEI